MNCMTNIQLYRVATFHNSKLTMHIWCFMFDAKIRSDHDPTAKLLRGYTS